MSVETGYRNCRRCCAGGEFLLKLLLLSLVCVIATAPIHQTASSLQKREEVKPSAGDKTVTSNKAADLTSDDESGEAVAPASSTTTSSGAEDSVNTSTNTSTTHSTGNSVDSVDKSEKPRVVVNEENLKNLTITVVRNDSKPVSLPEETISHRDDDTQESTEQESESNTSVDSASSASKEAANGTNTLDEHDQPSEELGSNNSVVTPEEELLKEPEAAKEPAEESAEETVEKTDKTSEKTAPGPSKEAGVTKNTTKTEEKETATESNNTKTEEGPEKENVVVVSEDELKKNPAFDVNKLFPTKPPPASPHEKDTEVLKEEQVVVVEGDKKTDNGNVTGDDLKSKDHAGVQDSKEQSDKSNSTEAKKDAIVNFDLSSKDSINKTVADSKKEELVGADDVKNAPDNKTGKDSEAAKIASPSSADNVKTPETGETKADSVNADSVKSSKVEVKPVKKSQNSDGKKHD